MTKIDIISGFLGAGKTTLINRLIHEAYKGEKIVLIENEFGQIGIDGGFLQNADVQIAEINSGCICCSLVGDFSKALKKVIDDYSPDRILIEPSGVGKLSDVTKAVLDADLHEAVINSAVVVVDVNKCKMYMKNFGEFFNDQIKNAGCILFSHTDKTTEAKLNEALMLVRAENPTSTIVTTPHTELDIHTLIEALEQISTLDNQLKELAEEGCPICGRNHEHHHEHDCDCEHHEHEHHHHHDHDCGCEHHEHEHHHHHDHDCDCEHHEHEHHHHHDHNCECGHHGHHHHHEHDCDCEHHDHEHHHHADEIFTSFGRETIQKYSAERISGILNELNNSEKFGFILRAKGIVEAENGAWLHFDYIPEEINVRTGSASSIGKICVIGSDINEKEIAELFGL